MSLKYRTSAGTSASNFSDLVVKVGDTLPIGTEVDYDGQTAPAGWQEVSETKLGDVVVDSIKSKNLCNISVSGVFPNSSGTVASNACYSAIIDTSTMTTLYISGNFSLLGDSLLRIGKYNSYPKQGTAGTRANLTTSGTIDVSTCNYLLLAFVPTTSSTLEQIRNSFTLVEGTSAISVKPYQDLNTQPGIYSGIETKTNSTWIDGKPIYRVVVSNTTGTINTTKTIATIQNLGEITRLDGFIRTSVQSIPGNFVYNSEQVSCYRENNNIIIRTTASSYASQNCYVIVEYTKTTD